MHRFAGEKSVQRFWFKTAIVVFHIVKSQAECKVELVFHWIQSIVVTSISVQRKIDVRLGLMERMERMERMVGWGGSKVILGQTTHIAVIASHNMLHVDSFLIFSSNSHSRYGTRSGAFNCSFFSLNTFSFRPY